MIFFKNLTKYVEKNLYNDQASKNTFDFYYSEFYFRTTDELKIYRSILKSKMIRNNSTSITLSLITLFFSFSINFVGLFKDVLLKQTDVAAETSMMFLTAIFLCIFVVLIIVNEKDDTSTRKNKRLFLMVEAIDKILSEREDNKK